jgi:hypothetical protein
MLLRTLLRTWQVEGSRLLEVPELPASSQGLLESRLEDWLASQPDAIQDELMVIGRQVPTSSGPLDLLGLSSDGALVVVELKRDQAPRQTVAQALDYASWIAAQSVDKILDIAASYLRADLRQAFRERFGQELPDLQLKRPSIRVVATRLDASTERMLQYLSSQFGMDIDGLVFRYMRFASGEELLVRASVVPEETRLASQDSGRISVDSLIELAKRRQSLPVLSELRALREFLSEHAEKTYGGSFRYRLDGRIICGVNVGSAWAAPEAAVDVWVSHGALAQATSLPEEALVSELEQRSEVLLRYPGSHQIILRVRSLDSARELVSLFRTWLVQPAQATDGVGLLPKADTPGTSVAPGGETS